MLRCVDGAVETERGEMRSAYKILVGKQERKNERKKDSAWET